MDWQQVGSGGWGGIEGRSAGRDSWNWGALGEWYGNTVQYKLLGIYGVTLVRTSNNREYEFVGRQAFQ